MAILTKINMNMNSQRGSALIMLFIAVGLFGMVGFAFLQGSRSNVEVMVGESAKAQATQTQDCSNALSIATKRLQARGCGTLISYNSDGSNDNAGAPSDGSCSMYHSNGGGMKDCDGTAIASGGGGGGPPPDPEACLDTLLAGQSCVGAVYAGTVGAVRIYAAPTDLASTTWNNGSGSMPNVPGANSNTDGMANTNAILAFAGAGTPYRAAANCRALGAKWYLPAPAELQLLEDVKTTGTFNGTFNTSGGGGSRYWSSRQVASDEARAIRLADGSADDRDKDESLRVRCIRQE